MNRRHSGILLHITSLPSQFGIGDLGPDAYRFVNFLHNSKQSIWQILPITPIDPEHGCSPYNSSSAFAGNIYLISPELLIRDGLLDIEDLSSRPEFDEHNVDFKRVIEYKNKLFEIVYSNFKEEEFDLSKSDFYLNHSAWLEDYAVFIALKKYYNGKSFINWPEEIRDRLKSAMESLIEKLHDGIQKELVLQYLLFKQWFALKDYCNQRDIHILGDMPFYVDLDSADVWSHPEIFKLDNRKIPTSISGVPPDYFSKTGQLWGNPVYNWEFLRKIGYSWWLYRMEHNLKLFDFVRLDHFRGFAQYWEVPAGAKTAINGRWVDGPGECFFNKLKAKFNNLPIIAEDLGVITTDVTELRNKFDLPGLKVLLFAFGEELQENTYLPHNYTTNCVVYTGTHDNNTILGWFKNDATEIEKKNLNKYLKIEITKDNINKELIELSLRSIANITMFPMQDLLCLGSEARMNTPSKPRGNWGWRLIEEQISTDLAEKLRNLTEAYGRA